jgi:hypothetical protein
MDLRRVLSCLLFLLGSFHALFGQSETKITSQRASVSAGESLDFNINLGQPLPCDTWVSVYFSNETDPNSAELSATASFPKGTTSGVLKMNVPFDQPSGRYRARRGATNPCPNFRLGSQFTVPDASSPIVTVVANSSAVSQSPSPTVALGQISLSLTQKQFLNTKISDLDELDTKIATRINENSIDNQALRNFLLRIVEDADKIREDTESDYRKYILRTGDEIPAFFADFKAKYDDLRTELKNTPITNSNYRSASMDHGLLLNVQLDQSVPHRSAGILPPLALSVQSVILDNIAALAYVRDNERYTFDIQLTSIPPGAHIKVKKSIDQKYDEYPVPTDVPKATLELASWDFKFLKDGCKDPVYKPYDPYRDSVRKIVADFTHCKRK